MTDQKPLGRKAYGSIGHLPASRLGPADHCMTEGESRICVDPKAAQGRRVWVQTKLDGTCVAVAKIGDEIVPLIRAGYRAVDSRREMHRLFNDWAMARSDAFDCLLAPGERVVGEWLAQAHGTRYDLSVAEPFVAFDIMREADRLDTETTLDRLVEADFAIPDTSMGSVEPLVALGELDPYFAYADDGPEGVVYRVESRPRKAAPWRVDFLAKWVRPDKVDGKYLSDDEPLWNWRP